MSEEYEATFHVDRGERIVEAGTRTLRYKGKSYTAHAMILERVARSGKKRRRGSVEIPKGLPIPGKGENAWDCGQDYIYGLFCKADSVDEIVRSVLKDARGTSRKRGG